MLQFAVTIEGLTQEGQAQWVLAIDPVGDRFLVTHEDKSLHWYPMAKCAFARMIPPDAPQAVIPVPPQQPTVLTPSRTTRRHPLINGA